MHGCRCLALALVGLFVFLDASPRADEVVLVKSASVWSYFPGLTQASDPIGAWRQLDFDDAHWAIGEAPLGYGEDEINTDWSAIDPPMEDNYTSMFLRQVFDVENLDDVTTLDVELRYDDGAIIWLNGVEVLRLNMRAEIGEDPDVTTARALRPREGPNRPVLHPIENYRDILREGQNVIAVQVFNSTISSGDVYIDLKLFDPFGPDITPPRVTKISPIAGRTVRQLTRIEVSFDEEVSGVDREDLLINGQAADSVTGRGAGPYRFQFAQPAAGEVSVAWAANPEIIDLAPAINAFEITEPWTYNLDPDAALPSVQITEFSTSATATPRDEDREGQEWIEIHNASASPVNLAGMSLSNDPDNPGKWIFPSRELEAGAYLIVFASEKDRRPNGDGNLHLNFQLSRKGGHLGLYSSDETRVLISGFADEYPTQRAGVSYGQLAGVWRYFERPTPGDENSGTSYAGFADRPDFDVPHGFFDEEFQLTLTSKTPGAVIYYTLDGKEPQPNGSVYEGPLTIAGSAARATVTVRARAFAEDLLPSFSRTQTYIFPQHLLTQPARPAGFPSAWGGGAPAADYDVDPQIVSNSAMRERMLEGFRTIPSLSIVTDVTNLWGGRGIYSNPTSSGGTWERDGSAEFITIDGSEGFQKNCGLRIQGGASRETNKSPKHSFRLLFKSIYGSSQLKYPLFPDTKVDSFDTVILRARYNNSWIHSTAAQRQQAQYTRDQWIRDSLRDMHQVHPHGRYVNLFVNGLYWGLYNLTERPSMSFGAEHFGGEKDDYDAVNSGSAVEGSTSAGPSWSSVLSTVARANLADPTQYAALSELIDMPAFADYMLMNFYGANSDWPSHNWYAGRNSLPGGKWRFFSWDAERTLESTGANRLSASDGNSPGVMFQKLKTGREFALLFGDRAHKHFFNDGALAPENNQARWMVRADEIDRAIAGESARWGDYRRDVHSWSGGPFLLYTVSHWQTEQRRLMTNYFPQRSTTVLNQLRSSGLYPRTVAPVFSQHGGAVEAGFTLEMADNAGEIYFTTDGTDPRVPFTDDPSPSAILYEGPIALLNTTLVKARSRAATGWSALNEAVFRLNENIDALHITEIMYHPQAGGAEFIELTNLGSSPLDISGLQLTNGVYFTVPDNTVLNAGERAIIVGDPILFAATRADIEPLGNWIGGLNNDGEKVTLRNAAGLTLLSIDYNDAGLWPVASDGFGYSLVLNDPSANPDSPEAWSASAEIGGSPNADEPVAPAGGVVINEILASASAPYERAIELYNPSDSAVDVSGWFLSGSRANDEQLQGIRIPDDTRVPSGGFVALFATDLEGLELSPMGGRVYLSGIDGDGFLSSYIVEAKYGPTLSTGGTSYGRHTTSESTVYTMLQRPTFTDLPPRTIDDFRSGTGYTNAAPVVGPVVINEIHYHPVEGQLEFIELANLSGEDLPLFDAASGRGWKVDGIFDDLVQSDFEFNEGTIIPSGGFLVISPVDPELFRELHALSEDVVIVGPFVGALSNGGERLRLRQPYRGAGDATDFYDVDSVEYKDAGSWPTLADGQGPSLERISAASFAQDSANWAASLNLLGTPGETNTVAVEEDGGYQRPGDINQDGKLNISDAVGLLGHLFRGDPSVLPCGDGGTEHAGNQSLIDTDGNAAVNLSDAVQVLNYLFLSGPAPALGEDCVRLPQCPEVCSL